MEIRKVIRRQIDETVGRTRVQGDVHVDIAANVGGTGRTSVSSRQRITQRSGRTARVDDREGEPDGREATDG